MVEEELKAIAAEGAFGKDCGLVSFVEDRGTCAKDQFMSSVMFGTAMTSDGSHHRIVIKLKLGDHVLRESLLKQKLKTYIVSKTLVIVLNSVTNSFKNTDYWLSCRKHKNIFVIQF